MKRVQFDQILKSLTPKMYSFTKTISNSEERVEHIIINAYTGAVVKQGELFQELLEMANERPAFVRKTILKVLYKEIFEACTKEDSQREAKGFDRLSAREKAILFLIYKEEMLVSEVQEILALQKHEIIQIHYKAKFNLEPTSGVSV